MFKIIIANQDQHAQPIRELFWEYLQWANSKVEENFGVSFDITSMLEEDMNTLDKFMPPTGGLLLGYVEGQPMGIACLKELSNSIGTLQNGGVGLAAFHDWENQIPDDLKAQIQQASDGIKDGSIKIDLPQ